VTVLPILLHVVGPDEAAAARWRLVSRSFSRTAVWMQSVYARVPGL